jgi:hypothetical protein
MRTNTYGRNQHEEDLDPRYNPYSCHYGDYN